MTRTGGFRRRYGEGPLHLLAQLVAFTLAGYAASRVLVEGGPWAALLLWFVGAALGHDLVLLPLYALADSAGQFRLFRRSRPLPAVAGVALAHYVRVPAALSALLLLVWFPLVLGGRDRAFRDTTGLGTEVYLGRWLAVTAVLFAASALACALRVRLVTRR